MGIYVGLKNIRIVFKTPELKTPFTLNNKGKIGSPVELVVVHICMCIFVGVDTYECIPFTGAGFGTYTSVDFALLMDVLKNKQDHAKDIAVWHQVPMLYAYMHACMYA